MAGDRDVKFERWVVSVDIGKNESRFYHESVKATQQQRLITQNIPRPLYKSETRKNVSTRISQYKFSSLY